MPIIISPLNTLKKKGNTFLFFAAVSMLFLAMSSQASIDKPNTFSFNDASLDMNHIFSASSMPGAMGTSAGGLTITGTGTIRNLRAYFYSDVSCSTFLGAATIIDNTNGFSFTNGQTISLNTSSAYQLANNRGITTANIACMKLFADGGNESANGVSCQSFTDFSCSGTSCTSSQTKSVTWATGATDCLARHVYFSSNGSGSQYQVASCDLYTGSGLPWSPTCNNTSMPLSGPFGVSLDNGYAYVSNYGGTDLQMCDMDFETGYLSSCAALGTNIFNKTQQSTRDRTYFYVANYVGQRVTRCPVSSSDGSLTPASCTTEASFATETPSVIINNGYAYITTRTSTVTKCTVLSDGTFDSCGTTGDTFTDSYGVGAYNGYIYVTSFNDGRVYKCPIGVAGALSGCTATGSASEFTGPVGIAMYNDYAYVTNWGGGNVTVCTIDNSGELTGCDQGAPYGSNMSGVAVF